MRHPRRCLVRLEPVLDAAADCAHGLRPVPKLHASACEEVGRIRALREARLCHAENTRAKMDIAPGGLSLVRLPCIRTRRTVNGQNSDGRRGERGLSVCEPQPMSLDGA